MTFATMEEAWGTIEPYQNYVNDYKNLAMENTNDNATNNLVNNLDNTEQREEPKNNNYTIETNSYDPVNTEQLETKFTYNLNRVNMELKEEISRLNRRLDQVLNSRINTPSNDFFNKNIQDILLFMIFGLLVMLLLDLITKFKARK